MKHRVCPNCGYPLQRDNHPRLSVVTFCRRSCIREWLYRHGKTAHEWRDNFTFDRRTA